MSEPTPLTAHERYQLESQAVAYAYGRMDAGQTPMLYSTRFADVAVADRVNVGDFSDLYERMLRDGDGVVGGGS